MAPTERYLASMLEIVTDTGDGYILEDFAEAASMVFLPCALGTCCRQDTNASRGQEMR